MLNASATSVVIYFASLFIAALLAAFFALWRYRSAKWWELKVNTYVKILESLHHVKRHFNHEYMNFIYSSPRVCDEIFEAEEYKKSHSPTERKHVKIKLKQTKELAFQEIEKCIDIGSFIISGEAVICLEKFNSDYPLNFEDEDLDHYFLRVSNAIDDCILKIKNIGEEDVSTFYEILLMKLKNILKSVNIVNSKT